MKRKILTLLLGISFTFAFATSGVQKEIIPQVKINPTIVSVTITQDKNDLDHTCVVMIEVNGKTYVGSSTSLSLNRACNAAYREALEAAEEDNK